MSRVPSVNGSVFWAVVLALTAMSCDQSARQERPGDVESVEHPHPDFRAPPEGSFTTVSSSPVEAELLPPSLRRTLEDLRSLTPLRSIGSADGDVVFGEIRDASFLGDDTFLVLDGQDKSVSEFGLDGSSRARFGGAGQGPGELVDPRGLAVTRSGALWVADVPSIHRFSRIEGEWAFTRRTAPLPLQPSAICSFDEGAVVNAHTRMTPRDTEADGSFPPVLFELRVDGELGADFGMAYRLVDLGLFMSYSLGDVACIRRDDRIAYLAGAIGEVRAYTTVGAPVWTVRFANHRPLATVVEGEKNVTTFPEDGEFDVGLGVVDLGDGVLLVQFGRSSRHTSRELGLRYHTVDSYLLDVASGEGWYIGFEVPHIVDRRGGHLLAVQEAPFPQVVVYQVSAGSATAAQGVEQYAP